MQRPSPTSGTPAGALPLWIVILCVGTIVAVSLGRAQSMGLYMPHVTQALGVGRESFGLAVALTQLLMGLGAPVSGALIDKHGAGRVVIVCTVLTVAGLWFMYSAASASDLIVGGRPGIVRADRTTADRDRQ